MEWDESVYAQVDILARLPDDEARARWNIEHGGTFRDLWEKDDDFKRMVRARDIDGIIERIEREENASRH